MRLDNSQMECQKSAMVYHQDKQEEDGLSLSCPIMEA